MQRDSLGVATSPARAWSIVALLWFTFLLNYIDQQTVFSIYPSLSRELGFTSVQLGLIGSVFLWVYSLSSAVTGRPCLGQMSDSTLVNLLIPKFKNEKQKLCPNM